MTLTKILMAGAAVGALAIALPAAAAPNIHVASLPGNFKTKVTGALHSKTDAGNPNATHLTQTVSFFNTLSASQKGVATLLWGETWYNRITCTQPSDQVFYAPKHTSHGKIAMGTSTGTISGCGSTIFTFQGPDYTLKNTTPGTDSFEADLHGRHFMGYNLLLNANTTVNIL